MVVLFRRFAARPVIPPGASAGRPFCARDDGRGGAAQRGPAESVAALRFLVDGPDLLGQLNIGALIAQGLSSRAAW
jgi:hypothetical protein